MAQQVACISSCPALPRGHFPEGQVSPRLQIPSDPWEPRGGGLRASHLGATTTLSLCLGGPGRTVASEGDSAHQGPGSRLGPSGR